MPLSLADRLVVSEPPSRDEVVGRGYRGPGPDRAGAAALREAGWEHDPIRIEVEKVIPVAAGLGGGSADAAAVLRLARGDIPDERIAAIARGLGADVSSQLEPVVLPRRRRRRGVEPLPAPASRSPRS